MSRRKEDATGARLLYLLLSLNAALAVFAVVIGYRAITALDDFSALMDAAAHSRKGYAPEGF